MENLCQVDNPEIIVFGEAHLPWSANGILSSRFARFFHAPQDFQKSSLRLL